jgi:hypothetical protein
MSILEYYTIQCYHAIQTREHSGFSPYRENDHQRIAAMAVAQAKAIIRELNKEP